MRRVLVTGAGGAPATNFIRSIRRSPEPLYLIGLDVNKYTLQRAETDEKHLMPPVSSPHYPALLRDILARTKPDFLHNQVDQEMLAISAMREDLAASGVRTFLPAHRSLEICRSKLLSYEAWWKVGLKVPGTMLLERPEDLATAFERFGPKLWLREIEGAAGEGSMPTDDPEVALHWVNFRKGWGRFTAAECLEAHSVTWQSVWFEGELMAAQGRKRLYWEFGSRAPSGVTGITGTGVTVSDPVVDEIALQAITAIDPRPHGIFGVDLTYDRDGVPNPTEINCGRFFTTQLFFTAAGLNLPYLYLKLGLGEPVDLPEPRVNPLRPGLAWVRGMDTEPRLVAVDEIESFEADLAQRLDGCKSHS